MVAAVNFFATQTDERHLLEKILAPGDTRLFPWCPMDIDAPLFVNREDLHKQTASQQRYGIIDYRLGIISFIGERPTTCEPNRVKSYVFDQINWDSMAPGPGKGIVNWDRTPALFWDRGTVSQDGSLRVGNIGSQASSMDDISPEYRKWVNRVMGWVRRKSVKVAQEGELTPDASAFDIRVSTLNVFYAMPAAMEFFRGGGKGRQ